MNTTFPAHFVTAVETLQKSHPEEDICPCIINYLFRIIEQFGELTPVKDYPAFSAAKLFPVKKNKELAQRIAKFCDTHRLVWEIQGMLLSKAKGYKSCLSG